MQSKVLKVYTYCSYLTDTDIKWRDQDYLANKAVKALKGQPIKGYFELTIGGTRKKFDEKNATEFAESVPKFLAGKIKKLFKAPLTIVPIPNSQTTSIRDSSFRTLSLANGTANACGSGYKAEPVLVFKTAQMSSHKGGTRNPDYLEKQYKIVSNISGDVLLIDDVCTTGAHFVSAARKLMTDTNSNVVGAVAFGGTTKVPPENIFAEVIEEHDLERSVLRFF